MAKITLKKNEEKRLKHGHLWVFSNEIQNTEGNPANGDLAEVYNSRQELLGAGFYNKNSLIACRLLSHTKIHDLSALFEDYLTRAYELRKSLYPNRDSYRLVFSESDFLPGLIIDKYNYTYVLQVYSAGIEKHLPVIVGILKNKFGAVNVFSKNEAYFRQLEGLPSEDVVYFGEKETEVISDGKIKYKINFELGHKTGFYFDQADNREFIEKIAAGRTVLDAFCNSGGFGLHAVSARAKSVTFLDSSASEIESAKENYQLNGFSNGSKFEVGDTFHYLEKCVGENRKFDIVNVDPPAFAKQRRALPTAIKGYEKLNRLAMSCVEDNGFLLTSSCSHHLSEDEFITMLSKAADRAGKAIQMIKFSNASMDHPQLPGMPETVYLKFAVLKVNKK